MRHILKSILLTASLAIPAGQLVAQQKDSTALADSVGQGDVSLWQQGPLFSVSKAYATGAVSSVPGEALYETPAANTGATLVGRLPGLYVKQMPGEPQAIAAMAAATQMSIRGRGTYGMNGNGGYSTMKIFVDGFETNLNYFIAMPAEDIQSVTVLKGAAALATFGMRGDEGVLWVTTKRGHIGKPTVSFQLRGGSQMPIAVDKPLGSYDYARLYNQAVSNDNGGVWSPRYDGAQLQAYKNGTGTDVDWYDRVLRSSAPYANGDLSFSGGNTTARYHVTLDYLNQQGLYDVAHTDETSNETLKRYHVRANLDFNLFKIFEARVDLGGYISDQQAPGYNTAQLWNNMARYPANIYPVMADSAEWSGTALYPDNPVASVKALGWTSIHDRNLLGNFGLREKLDFITPGLYLDEAYSFNSYGSSTYGKTATYARYQDGSVTTTDKTTPIKAQPQYPAGQEDLKQARITLGYSHRFGASRLVSALDYYQSNYRGDGLIFYATHYQNISGRVHYNYDDRYVAEFGFSGYGSDAFAPGHRWGFYPALSAGWIVSHEDFLKGSKVVSFLKIRASAGRSGGLDDDALQSGRYLYQQYYQAASQSGGSFYMGNANPAAAPILDPLYTANPDVFAEQSMKYDVGADLTLLHRLTLSADVFLDKRSHILTQDGATPDYFGYQVGYKNLGRVTNKGFELSGNYAGHAGQLDYALSAMVSFNKNRIDYMAETPKAYPYNEATGRAIGTPIGLVATGYYQLSDFNADGSLKKGDAIPAFGAVQPGDLKYKDLNGDGRIDQTDVTAIGNPAWPSLTYSFGGRLNYKGFDLRVLFTGAEGADVDILASAATQTMAFVNNGNVFKLAENAWAYYPEQGIDTRATATYPRLTATANNNNYTASTYWIKSADFLRLHNAELGYDFAKGLLKHAGVSKLRVYVSAVDALTWSTLLKNYKLDPETLGDYPALKSYNLGLSVTF
jgi:TonB-linked SusC/RagA family outer membrane protein